METVPQLKRLKGKHCEPLFILPYGLNGSDIEQLLLQRKNGGAVSLYGFGHNRDEINIQLVLQTLIDNYNEIVSLNLDGCQLEDKHIPLINFIINKMRIRRICLTHNRFSTIGIQQLLTGIVDSANLLTKFSISSFSSDYTIDLRGWENGGTTPLYTKLNENYQRHIQNCAAMQELLKIRKFSGVDGLSRIPIDIMKKIWYWMH